MNKRPPPIEVVKCNECGAPAVLQWVGGALCAFHRYIFLNPEVSRAS